MAINYKLGVINFHLSIDSTTFQLSVDSIKFQILVDNCRLSGTKFHLINVDF